MHQDVLERLDPETREKFNNGEISLEDLKGMGIVSEFSDQYGEEGEAEEEDQDANKDGDEPSPKKQNTGDDN